MSLSRETTGPAGGGIPQKVFASSVERSELRTPVIRDERLRKNNGCPFTGCGAGEEGGIKLSVLRRVPVIGPYRASSSRRLAGGYDDAEKIVENPGENRQLNGER